MPKILAKCDFIPELHGHSSRRQRSVHHLTLLLQQLQNVFADYLTRVLDTHPKGGVLSPFAMDLNATPLRGHPLF